MFLNKVEFLGRNYCDIESQSKWVKVHLKEAYLDHLNYHANQNYVCVLFCLLKGSLWELGNDTWIDAFW